MYTCCSRPCTLHRAPQRTCVGHVGVILAGRAPANLYNPDATELVGLQQLHKCLCGLVTLQNLA